MFEKKDYLASLNKARRKRNGKDFRFWLILAAAVLLLILAGLGIWALVRRASDASSDRPDTVQELEQQEDADDGADSQAQAQAEAERQAQEEADRQAVVDSYENLGIAQIEEGSYLNVRRTAELNGDIIGKMQQNAACEILSQEGDWYHIQSGDVDGYVSAQYILTGEEARAAALPEVKLRAIVQADSLNIRSAPELDPSNIVAQALMHERYEVLEELDGWIRIPSGYISSDYAELELCLNEARKMDLKAMAIGRYSNLLISKVNNYLNVRSSPEDAGNDNIIGKLPGKAAADILGEENGWYKIQSGDINGYVSMDPQYVATGQEAQDLAMANASLMAIVNTERLNVRMEPNTESRIWTQISKEERYPVVDQLDGWVQIELDAGDDESGPDAAYISTQDNLVEVRYALPEAIHFSPLEEEANAQASLRSQIVNYALQFVGNPYVWGGTSLTNGADCSGFTQSVLRHFGISIPRVSRDQSRAGSAVTQSEMRPGDLVFYTNSSGTVNHVAMYIGNGQVVHAASRRSGIKISQWNYRSPARIRNVID